MQIGRLQRMILGRCHPSPNTCRTKDLMKCLWKQTQPGIPSEQKDVPRFLDIVNIVNLPVGIVSPKLETWFRLKDLMPRLCWAILQLQWQVPPVPAASFQRQTLNPRFLPYKVWPSWKSARDLFLVPVSGMEIPRNEKLGDLNVVAEMQLGLQIHRIRINQIRPEFQTRPDKRAFKTLPLQ